MTKKKCLNEKRLTAKQVKIIVKTEGKLHDKLTNFFGETHASGSKDRPLVYELPNDRFLYVFDPEGTTIPGKGDIYPKEDFLRMVKWTQKVRDDYANNRGNSVAHWRYYSKHKHQIIYKIDDLIDELAVRLSILAAELDFSYKSLDIVCSKFENYDLDNIQVELYDNLVAYVGEILRLKVKGEWAISEEFENQVTPYINANLDKGLSPINVVWQELTGLEPMNLRKETANEVKMFSVYKNI